MCSFLTNEARSHSRQEVCNGQHWRRQGSQGKSPWRSVRGVGIRDDHRPSGVRPGLPVRAQPGVGRRREEKEREEGRRRQERQKMKLRGVLRRVAVAELGPDPGGLALVARFLETPSYARPLALELLDVAGSAGAPWELRRVSALMLHSQVLRLSPRAVAEFGLLCDRLGLREAGAEHVRDSVLAEGFTTTEPRAFARQLRARLSRARGVLAPLWEGKATPAALRDFFAYARRECRLDLARYLFTPEEVVERILSQVRSSRGAPHPFPQKHPYIQEEARRAFAGLPAYEAEILQRLGQGHRIFWVS